MEIPFGSHLCVSPDIMVRRIGDEAVVLNLKTEQYLGLDEVSNRFWELLTAGSSIQSVYDALLAEFEVDPGRLRADLEEFIEELLRFGLVEQRAE